MLFSPQLHNCRPVVQHARNRRPHISPPGQALIVSAAGCLTCQHGMPALNGEASSSEAVDPVLATRPNILSSDLVKRSHLRSRDIVACPSYCRGSYVAEDLNGTRYCFLCRSLKRALHFTPKAATRVGILFARRALGPGLFKPSVTFAEPSSGHGVVLVASWLMSLSMPQSWVLYTYGALQSAYTNLNVSIQFPPRRSIVCLVDFSAARGKTSDVVLTLLQPLSPAVRPAMRSQAKPEPGGEQNARLDEESNA